MRKTILLSGLGAIFIVAILLGVYYFWLADANVLNPNKPHGTVSIAPPLPEVNSAYRPEEYQENVNWILAEFWQNPNVTTTDDKLLELTLYSEFQDIHLRLVKAFLGYEQALNTQDEQAKEESLSTVREIQQQTSWINAP